MSIHVRSPLQVLGHIVVSFVLHFGPISTVFAVEEYYVADGYGVSGYDPVAYQTEGCPVEGNSTYTATHIGVTYRFLPADHRDLFAANPETYAPSTVDIAPLVRPWAASFQAARRPGELSTESCI